MFHAKPVYLQNLIHVHVVEPEQAQMDLTYKLK